MKVYKLLTIIAAIPNYFSQWCPFVGPNSAMVPYCEYHMHKCIFIVEKIKNKKMNCEYFFLLLYGPWCPWNEFAESLGAQFENSWSREIIMHPGSKLIISTFIEVLVTILKFSFIRESKYLINCMMEQF